MTSSQTDTLVGALLNTAAPSINESEAQTIAANIFGITGTARALTSERDLNFKIAASNGTRFVLKISNTAEPANVTNLQTSALIHIAQKDPSLPVSHVINSLAGTPEVAMDLGCGGKNIVRLFSYLEGEPLHTVTRTTGQLHSMGQCLAKMGLALSSFSHPAADYDLPWDIKQTAKLSSLLPAIENAAQRQLAENVVRNFEVHVLPKMPNLRQQVIHNDLNPHNILVAADDHDKISGILDFGDIVRTPLINDIAVAASYQIRNDDEPLADIAQMVSAYHQVYPLKTEEIDILFDLIAARLVTTVLITSWRAKRYPDNKNYILRNNPSAWAGLKQFSSLSRQQAIHILATACTRKTPQ